MQTLDQLRNSRAVASFISRPSLRLEIVIFCAGVTLLTVEAASSIYRWSLPNPCPRPHGDGEKHGQLDTLKFSH